MINILTVDIEDWYQTSDFNIDVKHWGSYESRIKDNTYKILGILSKRNIKATFFILSCIAREEPDLINEIVRQGHEIGSHGGFHKKVSIMTPHEFRQDIRESKFLLEEITGVKVKYFRAPCWSISNKNIWALEILEEEGFLCDSSFQTIKMLFLGEKHLPVKPFKPVINGKKLNITEIPSTVFTFPGFTIPFSGGFFLRAIPCRIIISSLKIVNKTGAGMVYIHPWEFDINQPRINTGFYAHTLHYLNINKTMNKFEILLDNFNFVSIGEYLDKNKFPHISLNT